MSNINYGAGLTIVVRNMVNGKPEGVPEELRFPVHSFEVQGGAVRHIDFNSTDEFSIASEFEQARTYQNITFFIKPGDDAPTVKLINLSKSDKRNFYMSFSVRVADEGKVARMIQLQSFSANFAETPIPVGNTPPLLKAKMSIKLPELAHGQRDEKRDVMVLKSI